VRNGSSIVATASLLDAGNEGPDAGVGIEKLVHKIAQPVKFGCSSNRKERRHLQKLKRKEAVK
jgi:hypothetical protein